jgi:2-(3-amino-3-carboxypropyl)histidine synthase
LGTLGRQGNPAIVSRLQNVLHKAGKRYYVLLVSEITTAKLQLLATSTDAWVQVACPRLSVDWGHVLGGRRTVRPNGSRTETAAKTIPVLSPYELFVCLESTPWRNNYPMDYYSTAGGPWSNYHPDNKHRQWQPPPPPP